jgi:hypothetical protein
VKRWARGNDRDGRGPGVKFARIVETHDLFPTKED